MFFLLFLHINIDNFDIEACHKLQISTAFFLILSVFLAFNKTMEKLEKDGLSLKNFTYTNKKIADDIYEAINSTSFLGVSVSAYFICSSAFRKLRH